MAGQQNASFMEMQRDAERRMREMQRKADRAVNGMPPVPNFLNTQNGLLLSALMRADLPSSRCT